MQEQIWLAIRRICCIFRTYNIFDSIRFFLKCMLCNFQMDFLLGPGYFVSHGITGNSWKIYEIYITAADPICSQILNILLSITPNTRTIFRKCNKRFHMEIVCSLSNKTDVAEWEWVTLESNFPNSSFYGLYCIYHTRQIGWKLVFSMSSLWGLISWKQKTHFICNVLFLNIFASNFSGRQSMRVAKIWNMK